MPALLTSASIRPNRVTAVSTISAAVLGVTDVSVNQRKIRRRRERICFGHVSRVCNDAITTFQKRLHGPRADPL